MLCAVFKMGTSGAPIALQDLLVGVSFLIILAIVNGLGVHRDLLMLYWIL